MSRRDTIIVAVLMNTGLLAALFMMAMHTEAPEIVMSSSTIAESVESQPIKEEMRAPEPSRKQTVIASRDEIDEVLKNYSMTNSQPVVITPEQPKAKASEPKRPNVSAQKETTHDGKYVEVTVKRGDYLEKIARANGTTVSAIMRANHLPSARIDVGQILRVPLDKKIEAPAKNQQRPPAQEVAFNEPQYYTIKSGDNPWKIAKQFHVKFDDLLKLNDLDEMKARNLKPGDVLRVK